MRGLKGIVIVGTLAAAAGVIAYRVLLTDEARTSLKQSADEVRDAVKTLNERLGENKNNEKESQANRQRTAHEWKMLGY